MTTDSEPGSLLFNSLLCAAGKYRIHSMASLVTASVHACTMSKLQKEMYPSLRQLSGWDMPLFVITTGNPGTA